MSIDDLENRMLFPYADEDGDEFLLPDEDDAYELERQIEIDEAARRAIPVRTSVADQFSAAVLDIAVARSLRQLRQAR